MVIGQEVQGFIINDILDIKALKKDFLFFFKKYVTLNCARQFNLIIDIGSGSGQFLYFIKKFFKKSIGIEVTDNSYNFSKEVLNLEIYKSIVDIKETFSVVTLWHSLEHIPSIEINNILSKLKFLSDCFSRIIVSVPNSKSIQYSIFKINFAFYDYPNHLHQFCYKSLVLLFQKAGFCVEKDFYSFNYILFGYIQGMLNTVCKIHNYFYYRKKRGINFKLSKPKTILLDLFNLIMICIFFIPALLMTFIEYFTKNKRAVITLCFKKKE